LAIVGRNQTGAGQAEDGEELAIGRLFQEPIEVHVGPDEREVATHLGVVPPPSSVIWGVRA
jgi:hypothetical protein